MKALISYNLIHVCVTVAVCFHIPETQAKLKIIALWPDGMICLYTLNIIIISSMVSSVWLRYCAYSVSA